MASKEIREKIGQMLLVGFRGFAIADNDPIAHDIAERNIGGVILYDQHSEFGSTVPRNIESPVQLRTLIGSLQGRAKTPLMVAIDQEGGKVNRLKPGYGFPESISQEELGTADNAKQTFDHACRTAETLASVGINLNFAPVVDLGIADNLIRKRGRILSPDPQTVFRHAAEFIKAHRQQRIITCPKHFPGHGSALNDSHFGFTDVTARWTEKELSPFRQLIEAGLCDCVMTAHIFNAKLDYEHPATLSKPVVGGLLRGKLKFGGVVITDDLGMKAISEKYGFAESLRLAIEAGADLLCLSNTANFDPRLGEKAAGIIEELVDKGTLSETRIEESFQRVRTLKRSFGLMV